MNGIEVLVTISEIRKRLNTARTIALFTHKSIDGDAIGSMLALYEFLESKNRNVSMFCDDKKISEDYLFLKNADKINKKRFGKYDLMIAVDCASVNRLGKYREPFLEFENTINIDHHVFNTKFAKINFILPYSSCGEVVFEVLKQPNVSFPEEVATALFTAVSSDTGGFINDNVDAKSHMIAGELIVLGADSQKANLYLHRKKSLNKLKLAGYMCLNLELKNGVSYLILNEKTLNRLKVSENDAAQFINLVNNVDDSKITLIIKEIEKDKHKISFRSIEGVDVRQVAATFGGGGHKNASGCVLEGKADKILKDILKECYLAIDKGDRGIT